MEEQRIREIVREELAAHNSEQLISIDAKSAEDEETASERLKGW